jgi:hypothetical protein
MVIGMLHSLDDAYFKNILLLYKQNIMLQLSRLCRCSRHKQFDVNIRLYEYCHEQVKGEGLFSQHMAETCLSREGIQSTHDGNKLKGRGYSVNT